MHHKFVLYNKLLWYWLLIIIFVLVPIDGVAKQQCIFIVFIEPLWEQKNLMENTIQKTSTKNVRTKHYKDFFALSFLFFCWGKKLRNVEYPYEIH